MFILKLILFVLFVRNGNIIEYSVLQISYYNTVTKDVLEKYAKDILKIYIYIYIYVQYVLEVSGQFALHEECSGLFATIETWSITKTWSLKHYEKRFQHKKLLFKGRPQMFMKKLFS